MIIWWLGCSTTKGLIRMFEKFRSLFATKAQRLRMRRDYEGLANLLRDPNVADEAAQILVQAGDISLLPVINASKRAFSALAERVKIADPQTHMRVRELRAHVVVLGRLGNAECIPIILDALAYSACVVMMPIETWHELDSRSNARSERLRDPSFVPTPEDLFPRLEKALFLNYRACRSLGDSAAEILESFGERAIGKLIPFLADARPPVIYVVKNILERIGTPNSMEAAAKASVQMIPPSNGVFAISSAMDNEQARLERKKQVAP